MKDKLFIFLIIFSIFISWLPGTSIQTEAATTYTNLGVANDFNVFVFDNHTQKYSDSEGRVAVGNRAEYTGYGIGDKLTPTTTERDDLIVGQALYADGGMNFNGNTVIDTDGTIEKYTMTNNNGQKEPLKKEVSDFFAQAEADLKNKSSKWSQLTPNATAEMQDTTLVLKGDNRKLNVFSLTTEDFKNLGLFKLDVPDDATVLINVFGTDLQLTNFALKKGEQDLPPSDGSRILWNFPNLINFDMKYFGMVGSILAPYATLAPTGTGQINGTLIVKNFTNMVDAGIEAHHYPFNAKLPLEDEEKGTIEFTKVDKITQIGLKGAVFGLYDNVDCQGDARYTETTNVDGLVRFENIPYGTYYLKEITAPEGYQLSKEIRKVTVDKEKVTEEKFENERIQEEPKGSIQITKVEKGNENTFLKGATFRLYLDKGCTEKADHADVTSDENGVVTFTNLPYDTYYVKEITAPTGYQLSDECRTVIVNKEKVDAGTFVNERIKELVGTIEFTKVDKETGKGIEGAVFGLYDNAECKGDAKYEATSNSEGLVRFDGIPYGTYYLKEIKAPEGYQAFDKILPIEVNRSYQNLGKIEDEAIKDPTGSIELKKIDSKDKKVLEGAEFALYQDGKAVKTGKTDKNGFVTFENLSYGTYEIKETKAPNGYQLSDEVKKIEIKSNKKVEIEFENSLIDQSIKPDSSDDNDSTNQLADSDSNSNSNASEKVGTGVGSKQQTSKGMFINGLPQTGDTFIRVLIALGVIFIVAGIIFLTRRAKR